MNRNTVFAGLAVVVISFYLATLGVSAAGAAELKIGYVDMAKVFAEYSKTKEAEKSLEERAKAKDGERKKLVDEIKKLKDEQALLSEKAKVEKQKVIDEKIKALQDFDRVTRDEIFKERNERLGVILKDIESIVSAYSKEKGYDFIIDSRALLYGKEGVDLTSDILSRLNK